MIPARVKSRSSFIAYTDFFDTRSQPLALSQAVGFVIRNSEQKMILSGIAEQTNKPERWQSQISLPDLPPDNYTISWYGKTDKTVHTNSESFEIANETPNFYELDLLVPERSLVTDVLKVDSDEVVTNLVVNILTPDGISIFSDETTNPTPIPAGDKHYYPFNSAIPVQGLVAGGSVFALYLIEWSFNLNDMPSREHHFIYVVNHKTLMYVNELKRMIDKANLRHKNPNLRYNNVDMVAYLNQGLQYINAQPPSQTSYTLANIPDTLYSYVLDAAALRALESRYLAEGEAAFNFNGQPITLEVDRTPFIESAIGRYQEKLTNLNAVKKGIIMSGGGGGGVGVGSGTVNSQGVLTLSRGPLVSISPFGFNSRVALYSEVINELGY